MPGEAAGAAAFAQRHWSRAYEELAEAEQRSELSAMELDRFGLVTHLLGREAEGDQRWERAHRAYIDMDNPPAAARVAFWLAIGHMERGEMAQAGGWLARAGRILDETEVDCPERGYIRIPEGLQLLEARDPVQALHVFEDIQARGQRFKDIELTTLGRLGAGQALIRQGRSADGAALLDEVMVAVVSDELSPLVAGIVYCAVIEVCIEMFDFRRGQEWTEALTRWCDSQPDLVPFRGRCQVYRAEMMRIRGDWQRATEMAFAAEQILLGPPRHPAVGSALYQQAELQRLTGAFDDADATVRRAEQWGSRVEPGRALLRLGQGRTGASVTAIQHALNEAADNPSRAHLLPAAVEILCHAGNSVSAAEMATTLVSIASELQLPWLQAEADRALGIVALADSQPAAAMPSLRSALESWQLLAVPYELARTRVLLATACDLTGDHDSAAMHFEAAREVFVRLGALPDLRNLERVAGREAETDGLTSRELEVLRLVATGMTNRAIANHLVISEKTVANHVGNILGKLGLSSRAAATAFAYERGLV